MKPRQTQTTKIIASNIRQAIEAALAKANEAHAEALALKVQAEQLFARGTREDIAKPKAAISLDEKIEAVLNGPFAPVTFEALCSAVEASAGKVSAAMKKLREAGKIYNLGNEYHPRWIWIIGDKGPTSELNAHVARLISLQPMTFQELLSATGARRGRVSGALVDVQKTRKDWQNLGDERVYRWFLPPTGKRGVKRSAQ